MFYEIFHPTLGKKLVQEKMAYLKETPEGKKHYDYMGQLAQSVIAHFGFVTSFEIVAHGIQSIGIQIVTAGMQRPSKTVFCAMKSPGNQNTTQVLNPQSLLHVVERRSGFECPDWTVAEVFESACHPNRVWLPQRSTVFCQKFRSSRTQICAAVNCC